MSRLYVQAAATLLLMSLPAWADEPPPQETSMCTDRPSKDTATCTVDAGRFQLEWDIADGTFQRRSGVTTDLWYTAPSLKYGLTPTWDIEATFAPYQNIRVHNASSTTNTAGIGDLVLASQYAFAPSGAFSSAVRGFIKVPTADASKGLGNGALEGGVLVPLGYTLSPDWSLSSTPQANVSLNSSGNGRHAQFVDALGLFRSLPYGFSVGAEVWTLQDFDPAGTNRQYSADVTTAWLMNPDTQFDASMYFGLNRATPDVEITIGLSRRL